MTKEIKSVNQHSNSDNSSKPILDTYRKSSKRCTLLKRLHKQGGCWFKLNLGIFKLRKFWGILNLGTTRLFAHLPKDFRHFTSNLGSTRKDHRTITRFKHSGMLLHCNQSSKRLDWFKLSLLFEVNNVSRIDLWKKRKQSRQQEEQSQTQSNIE